jgi:ribose 5-phosphate isomerase B
VRIALGSDEATPLTEYVAQELAERGHQVVRVGALAIGDDARWPAVGRKVGTLVASRACDEGIVFCYTGTGVTIAANKVPGVRAALCADAQTAAGARRWNHANVLAMSLRTTTTEVAGEILESWFSEPFGEGEDADMVAMLARNDPGSISGHRS